MIRYVVLDFDGVLTDGKQYVDHTGEKVFKALASRDIRAMRELVARGYDVVVMSADDWPGGPAFCERAGVRFEATRDKLARVRELGWAPAEVAAVGDDAWDVALLQWCEYPFCPSDAEEAVRELPGMMVLTCAGGAGVVGELVKWLTS